MSFLRHMGNKELYQMSNARIFKPVLGIAIFIVLGTLILTWGNAKAQSASGITVATGTPQPYQGQIQYHATMTPPPTGSGQPGIEVHVQSSVNAANPNHLNPGAIPQSAGTNPPVYQVSASCTLDAYGTFSITNTGGPMTGSGNWVLTDDGTFVTSQSFSLNPGASVSLGTSGLYGTLTYSVSGGGGQPASAMTICPYPTATPTSTLTNTPVPPRYLVNANCTADAYGTFSITNTGGPMIGNGTWVFTQNGTTLASNPFSLAPGATLPLNTSGLYGTLVLSASGGGAQPASAQTFCGPVTATPTATSTLTNTASSTPTATNSATATASNTATVTPSRTATLTSTSSSTATNSPTRTATATATPRPANIDTIGIYRSGTFLLRLHNSQGFADISAAFTAGTKPLPVVGDWTGAGFDSIGVYDQAAGNFYLRNTISAGSADEAFTLGNPNDTPLSGRWQLSATHAGAGVFRPSNGVLYLKNALNTGFADNAMVLGSPGDEGIAGDWTGKGFDSAGIFRPSSIGFFLSNQVTNGPVFADITLTYGSATDLPIAGDWIAQGHDGIGMFRPTNGFVYLKNALTTGFADNSFFYGQAGDVPIAGHWQVTYPPIAPVPVLIAKTAIPQPKSISVQGDNRIGG